MDVSRVYFRQFLNDIAQVSLARHDQLKPTQSVVIDVKVVANDLSNKNKNRLLGKIV